MPFLPTLTHFLETEFLLNFTSYQDCMFNYSDADLLSSSNAYYCINQGCYLAAIFFVHRYSHVAMLLLIPLICPRLYQILR